MNAPRSVALFEIDPNTRGMYVLPIGLRCRFIVMLSAWQSRDLVLLIWRTTSAKRAANAPCAEEHVRSEN